jgi:hypothetical protein
MKKSIKTKEKTLMKMKKRILSMLLAAVMVLTMIPAVAVPVTASTAAPPPEPGTHPVNIVARCAENWLRWRSEPIVVRGAGTYTGTLDFGGDAPTNLVGLVIASDISWIETAYEDIFEEGDTFRWATSDFLDGDYTTDPRVPEAWSGLAVQIESITVNGSIQMSSDFRNFFRRRERGGTVHIIDYAMMELWNGWHPPHNTLAITSGGTLGRGPSPDAADAESFSLPGNVPFTSMDITFRVFETETNAAARPASTDNVDVRLATVVNNRTVQGDVTRITGAGDNYSVSINSGIGVDQLGRLAIISDGGGLSPIMPFIGSATPGPVAWRQNMHVIITDILVNGASIGANPTTRWHQIEPRTTPEGINSHLLGQPSNDNTFSQTEGYVDIQLWNSYHAENRSLSVAGSLNTFFDEVDTNNQPLEPIDFGLARGTNINSIVVNFRVVDANAAGGVPCPVCATENPIGAACSERCGSGLVTAASRTRGTRDVADALQILRSLVGLTSEITTSPTCPARRAAMITDASKAANAAPTVQDALQILRGLVGLSTVWS